jgi:hypothetical protein
LAGRRASSGPAKAPLFLAWPEAMGLPPSPARLAWAMHWRRRGDAASCLTRVPVHSDTGSGARDTVTDWMLAATAGQCRNLPSRAEDNGPPAVIEPSLATVRIPHVLYGLFPAQAVDTGVVLQQPLPLVGIMGEQDVRGAVAVLAQGPDAPQPLAAGRVVVAPDLVAMQLARPAAGPAAVPGPAVGRSAQTVPQRARQELGEAGPAGTGRDGFDGQSQGGHVEELAAQP